MKRDVKELMEEREDAQPKKERVFLSFFSCVKREWKNMKTLHLPHF